MDNAARLLFVKLLHTVIWGFFVFVIGYVLWSGISGSIGAFTWIGIGAVVIEGIVLAFNNGRCPLTIAGMRYTERREDNFDIFLPNWLAKHNKVIFTSIFIVAVALVVYRTFW